MNAKLKQQSRRNPVLKMKTAVTAFMSWVKKNPGLVAEIEKAKGDPIKIFRLTKYTEDGIPWITVGMDMLPADTPDDRGWYEIIRRKCEGKLLVDQFDKIGVGMCSSVEEFTFRISVCSI